MSEVLVDRDRFTRAQLAALLFARGGTRVRVRAPGGAPVVGVFQGATRESGCGTSFLLHLLADGGKSEAVWVRVAG